MSTRIPSEVEYEAREVALVQREMAELERAPLSERKDAAQAFYETMRDDPARVAERIGWIIDGNYGRGHYIMARRILASPRMNRAAALTNIAAAAEWRCPQRMVAAAWKKLTSPQKKMLDAAIQVVIKAAEAEMKKE
jgi:hypothetical protein